MLGAIFFFFFQAEDGIRDLTVTGVQTCALPISAAARSGAEGAAGRGVGGVGSGRPNCLTSLELPRKLSALCPTRSEEHTSELQSQSNLVCRLLLEKKKKKSTYTTITCLAQTHQY